MAQNIELFKKMTQIGLSETEARIYISMLSLGETSILAISRASGIKRSTIYPLIENLRNIGLVAVHSNGFKKKYIAEHPRRISSIIDRKRDEMLSILPSLESLYTMEGKDILIKTYEGVDAMKSVYDELLTELRDGDEYLVIGDPDRWDSHARDYFKKYIKKRLRINLDAKLLLINSDLSKEYKKFEKNFNEKVRLLPKGYNIDSNVIITKNKIIIHQLYSPVLTIVIESKSVINLQQNMFKILWGFL